MSDYAPRPRRDLGELFRRAKAVDLVAYCEQLTKLKGSAHDKRGVCPLCRAGEKSSTPPFSVRPLKRRWTCYSCGLGGDILDLDQQLVGGTAIEAAERLAGPAPLDLFSARRPDPVSPVKPSGPSFAERMAISLWSEAVPAADTLVETYLRSRALPLWVVDRALPALRFHPRALWQWSPDPVARVYAPAMIAQPVTPSGPTGGVHATYLAVDGRGKADLSPAKRMWGPQRDSEGRAGGVWLIGPEGDLEAMGGEGIESTLSAVALQGKMMRAFAALSLGGLQGRALRDDDGLVDVFHPVLDPESRPFVWPGIDAVCLALDRDMKPVRARGRNVKGKPCDFQLDSEARARICARLAGQAWKAVGSKVRAIAPRRGEDFNDRLRARAAQATPKTRGVA